MSRGAGGGGGLPSARGPGVTDLRGETWKDGARQLRHGNSILKMRLFILCRTVQRINNKFSVDEASVSVCIGFWLPTVSHRSLDESQTWSLGS